MHREGLKNIVNHIASYNPDLEGHVFGKDTEFRGITDARAALFYVRILSEGDKTVRYEKIEDGLGDYMVSFDFKLVLQAKCYNEKVIPVLIKQLEELALMTIQDSSDLTEEIYEAETDKKIQRNDLQLYAIYANYQFPVNMERLVKCSGSCEINLVDCGC